MTIAHWINGEAASGGARSQPVFDPATGQSRQEVQLADRATVERAIAAAERAYPAWRDTPPLKRARIMLKLKTLLEQHADAICRLITAEHGKVHGDAMGELQRGIENIEYAGYAPELLKGEHSKDAGPGIDSWSEFQPLGVAAGITSFNFPAMVPLWMWPMAVVCGNTFVLKPSERVPSSTLYIARLASEAGLPPGVLNVVNGDREAVETLLHDDRVKAVSFVGSTPVAEHVYHTGCGQNKRVQALGGAKNHAVVLPDADIAGAVSALMGAAFGSCGQRCMAIPLVVAVGDDTAEALIAGLRRQMAAMRVGPGRATTAATIWGRWSPCSITRRSKAISIGAWPKAQRCWSTGESCRCGMPTGGPARAISSARRCSTALRPTCGFIGRRSSVRCWAWCASTGCRKRWT
ncbi:Methylmalonate-semialdehyde dehydrogenase [acylating] [Serratia ficaria]|nr:Methylmalonate-semialdehyde dehydrogenase [acylating] [Serratia ficaria]